MPGTYLRLAALLIPTAITVVLATSSAVPVAAAAADKYTGRMVIIRAPGARVLDVSVGGATLNKWQQQRQRRLVEDEVAPEFGGGQQLGAGNDGINNDGLDPNRQVCPKKPCAAKGQPYVHRPCAAIYGCPGATPPAGHARAVHV